MAPLNFDASTTMPDWTSKELMTGTTIMAAEFDGGVLLGADSRTTTGAYIANRVTDKLTRVADNIFCCRSGSAADTQAIANIVSYHVEVLSIELGEEPLVFTAANIFKNFCYNYRDTVMAGIIVAGYDNQEGGQVYRVPLGGMLKRQSLAIGGSGSTYIYGYVDSNFHSKMSKEECSTFVKNALALAMQRDGSSGGVIRQAIITKEGVERRLFVGDDIPKFNI